MRSILNYPGSKNRLAEDIIGLFPDHHTYIEPFFGSGAIFFSKKKAPREIINDIDSRIYNFFKVLREHPDELVALVSSTPWSREEHANSFHQTDDPIEDARRFPVRTMQTHAGNINHSKSWRFYGQKDGGNLPTQWKNIRQELYRAAERLLDAYIEHQDALQLIKRYDFDNVLMYLDPPYPLRSIDSNSPLYKHTLSDQEHEEFLNVITSMKSAKIVVSTYENKMYDQMLAGWRKLVIHTTKQTGKKAQEVIYLNYEPQLLLV